MQIAHTLNILNSLIVSKLNSSLGQNKSAIYHHPQIKNINVHSLVLTENIAVGRQNNIFALLMKIKFRLSQCFRVQRRHLTVGSSFSFDLIPLAAKSVFAIDTE